MTGSTLLLSVLVLLAFAGIAAAVAICVARDCRSHLRPPPRSRQPLNAPGWVGW